jgi:NAD(P)-dependent dehydrogenase (short-subunit alcohol dehydrogenase family)
MPTTQPAPGTAEEFSLAGKVAIVTGASRGIGRSLCLGLARAGAKVVAAARNGDQCMEVAKEIENDGGDALPISIDVTKSEDRERLIADAVAQFGGLDVLVNNAGVLRPHMTVRVSEEELDSIIAVTLKAPVFLSQLALPHLEQGGGSIVNIGALGAFQPMAGLGAYCAVKAAMVNWTLTMAKEWTSRGVRVNLVVPGPVATDMILPRDDQAREKLVANLSQQVLLGRLLEPDDLVGAVVFLASPASTFMTGRPLFLDGGMLA